MRKTTKNRLNFVVLFNFIQKIETNYLSKIFKNKEKSTESHFLDRFNLFGLND